MQPMPATHHQPIAVLYVMPAGLPIWAPEGLGDWQFEHNLDCLRLHHAHLRKHHAMAARASRRHPEHLANAAACRRLIAALLPALRRYEADERAA